MPPDKAKITSSSSSRRFVLPSQVICWRANSCNAPKASVEARVPPPEKAATMNSPSLLSASGGAKLLNR